MSMIPPIDSDSNPTKETMDERRELLELERLEAEQKFKNLAYRETKQRLSLKRRSVRIGMLVIIAMFAVLGCILTFGSSLLVDVPFSVAIVVALIVSITVITTALLVGAFRKFEEKDLETIGNGATSAANVMRGY